MSIGIVCELMWRHNFVNIQSIDHIIKSSKLESIKTHLRILAKQQSTIMFDDIDFDFTNNCRLETLAAIFDAAERVVQRKIGSARYITKITVSQ